MFPTCLTGGVGTLQYDVLAVRTVCHSRFVPSAQLVPVIHMSRYGRARDPVQPDPSPPLGNVGFRQVPEPYSGPGSSNKNIYLVLRVVESNNELIALWTNY